MCAFGVDKQFKISVSIGKFEDFLTFDKFNSFILCEEIGFALPTWELSFDCVYPDLLSYLNEKQEVLIQMGTDTYDLEPFYFTIKKPFIQPKSTDCASVILRGFLNMMPYLENEVKAVYEDKTSKDLAESMAKKHGLVFKSNIKYSNISDKMTYYQPSTSDYKFLFDSWLHSYVSDSDIIIPAISANKTMSYNSLKTLIAENDLEKLPTFTDSIPENEKEIQVNANCNTNSDSTISNLLGNYTKERYIFNQDTNEFSHIVIENNKPIISESKTTTVDESISRSSGFYVQNSNVHTNYYKQELVNTQKYFSIQSSKQWVSTKDSLVMKLHPGDLALYMSKKSNTQINDQVSGMYLINKKVISIKNRVVHTNFLLTRENMNYSK